MQVRVTAILLAHSRDEQFEATLQGIREQSRPVDRTIVVNLGPILMEDDSNSSVSGVDVVLQGTPGMTVGKAIDLALTESKSQDASQSEDSLESSRDWLWILPQGTMAKPRALFELVARAEGAPSADLIGPMLLDPVEKDRIAVLAETMTRFGASVPMVENEFDQGQHDDLDDVLGVGIEGALVRRSQWELLGGSDPGLPSIDAALDFSVRTRLSGRRVIVAPRAKIVSAGGAETLTGSKVGPAKRFRIARTAQLHRRLVYAPWWALPFHWLSLLPLALFRSVGDLVGKFPDRIAGEFLAAITAAFRPGIFSARKKLRASQKTPWESLKPLRISSRELRARRVLEADDSEHPSLIEGEAGKAAQFFRDGGAWTIVVLAIIGLVAFGSLIGSSAVVGGGLRPLSSTVHELWANIGYGWRNLGSGALGAADPFTVVLAVLGTITFWSPSASILFCYLFALPIAGLGGWYLTKRIVDKTHLPILGAVLWAFSPPFLVALANGRIGAVIAHLLLPWLIFSGLRSAKLWGSAAASSILLAATIASAPSLAPALAVLILVLWITHPLSLHRTGWIPIPTLVLFAPLIIQQVLRGNPLALLADPGVPISSPNPSKWMLLLSDPGGLVEGWAELLGRLGTAAGIGSLPAWAVVLVLLGPILLGIVFAALIPGSKRSLFGLGIAVLGFLTALAATAVQTSAIGASPVTAWTGSGLSLYWLGAGGALLIGVSKFGPLRVSAAIVTSVTASILAIPLLGAMLLGSAKVFPSDGRIMPALVAAQATTQPDAGTLVLQSIPDQGIVAQLERGQGARLDDQSTLIATRRALRSTDLDLQKLAGNLAVPSGFQAGAIFQKLNIEFVLVPDSNSEDESHRLLVDSLNSNEVLSPVGHTKYGNLWQYIGNRDELAARPANGDTAIGSGYLWLLGVAFGAAFLLAIPTGRGKKAGPDLETRPDSLGEDEND